MPKRLFHRLLVSSIAAAALVAAGPTVPSADARPVNITTPLPIDDGETAPPLPRVSAEITRAFEAEPNALVPVFAVLRVTRPSQIMTPSQRAAYESAIRAAQDVVRGLVANADAAAPSPDSIVPASMPAGFPVFAASISGPALAVLRNSTAVAGIAYDTMMNALPEESGDSPSARTLNATQLLENAGPMYDHGVFGGGSPRPTVAVIDTGANLSNEDVVAGLCFSTESAAYLPLCVSQGQHVTSSSGLDAGVECNLLSAAKPGNVDASWIANVWCGHGTDVAQAIAGGKSTDSSFRGTAPDAGIIRIAAYSFDRVCNSNALQFHSSDVSSPAPICGGVRHSDLMSALDWVRQNAATFNIAAVNMSMGFFNDTSTDADCDPATNSTDPIALERAQVLQAFRDLRSAGVAPVAAVGNWNDLSVTIGSVTASKTRSRVYPSCLSAAVSAGYVGSDGAVMNSSQGWSGVDLFAPLGASSMATASISASFALLRELSPAMEPDAAESLLKSTGVRKSFSRNGVTYTKPLIDLGAALDHILNPSTSFTPVNQSVIADPRTGTGTDCATNAPYRGSTGSTERRIRVTGRGGIPSGAKSVVLGVTATSTTALSTFVMWGASHAGEAPMARPAISTTTWPAGATVTATVFANPDRDGCVSMWVQNGSANVIVEAEGYSTGTGGRMTTLKIPKRLKPDNFADSFVAAPKVEYVYTLGTTNGDPAMSAVNPEWAIVSITGNEQALGTSVAVQSGASTLDASATSNLNLRAGGARESNLALVKLDNRKFKIETSLSATRLSVDLLAWGTSQSTTALATTGAKLFAPQRVFDSRCPGGTVICIAKLTQLSDSFQVCNNVQGLPSSAKGVIVNVTTTEATAASHWAGWAAPPGSSTAPFISQGQAEPGRTLSSVVVMPLDSCAYRMRLASGQAHVIMDVIGYVQ